MTAQDVVNKVSQDIRSQLASSGADANILLDYVDRIHKDCLHSGVYSHLSHAMTTIATVNGTSAYALGVTDVRQPLYLYDRTRNRGLNPLTPDLEHTAARLMQSSYLPEFWKYTNNTVYFFPTPRQSLTIEFHYAARVATVSALGTTLTIPDDGLDLVVAGVNWLAHQFLKNESGARTWFSVYQSLKQGEKVSFPEESE